MTNKVWMVACSAILGCATTAMAQTAPQSQSTTSTADKKIVVTGCLAAASPASPAASTATGTAGTTGTTGTTGTATTTGTAGTAGATTDASPAFQLTNATVAAADDAAKAGETATDSSKAAAGQTYRLIANPTALSPHVGKKLALTGTLEEAAPATASAAAGSEAKGPALRVESGKILAESCNQ